MMTTRHTGCLLMSAVRLRSVSTTRMCSPSTAYCRVADASCSRPVPPNHTRSYTVVKSLDASLFGMDLMSSAG